MKKLVGGGTMTIVNQTMPAGAAPLGYTAEQIDEIIAYIDEHRAILGAPHLDRRAPAGVRLLDGRQHDPLRGHVRMMGAVQPFISGAISKTVNLPEEATVEEVEQLRTDCLAARPQGRRHLPRQLQGRPAAQHRQEGRRRPTAATPPRLEPPRSSSGSSRRGRAAEPIRQKLPRTRASRTFEFRVADCKGFVTVGEYDDGRPGEIFLRVSKQGSTLAGIMDAFAISVSHGLQYGVPLRAFVEAFTNMRFEPAGMTDDPDIRIASSIMDYLFRRLALEYLTYDERAELGILTIGERTAAHAARRRGERSSRPARAASSSPTREHPVGRDCAPRCELGVARSTEQRHHHPGGVAARPRPPSRRCATATPRCACSAVSRWSGPARCHACPSCGSTSGCS